VDRIRSLAGVAGLSFGTALVVLDGGIANVALPTIAHDLGVDSSAAVLIVTVYQLVLVMALLPLSAVGERIGLTPTLDARLREGARGRWEGHLFEEIERDEPDRHAAWMRAGAGFRFPGGESLLDQQLRVTQALREIHAAGPLPALGVCHGGSIRVMLCWSDPHGLGAFHQFEVPNVAVVTL